MTDTEIQELQSALDAIDPAMTDYQTWLEVGQGIKEAGGDVGMWDAWSARDGGRYHPGECEKKWNSFQSVGITKRTVFDLAYKNGWSWNTSDNHKEIGWNDQIGGDDYKVIDKGWIEVGDFKEPTDAAWDPIEDIRKYLSVIFAPEDIIGYNTKSLYDEKAQKWKPADKGNFDRPASYFLEQLAKAQKVEDVFLDYEHEAGAWIRFNPLDGQGVNNVNVREFRYALVESDNMPVAQQEAVIRELELPVAALLYSGGKSIHAIVHIDADSFPEYKKRVEYLYNVCKKNGMILDEQNKNPSRLSRMPGFERGSHKQFLIDTNIGKRNWQEWEEWIEGVNDDLPDIESLESDWNNLPPLNDELISGLLRQGHKMLISGPSKAGKSFLLIALTIAIAEGRPWLGHECAQGKVLYVNLELDKASCLHRFKDVYDREMLTPNNLNNIKIWNLRGKTVPMDKLAPKLIRRCQKEKYIAVIIDPIYKVITGDENSAEQMSKFCNQFDKIATEMNTAVIYCHHHSKGAQGGKRAMDRASGSGVFARDPDALLDLFELVVDVSFRNRKRMELEMETAIKWTPGFSLTGSDAKDYQKVMETYWTTARSFGTETQAEERMRGVARRSEQMTAWRVDATLREFAKPSQTDMWFDFPVHEMDTGILKDVVPESEMSPQEIGSKRNKSQNKKDKRKNDRQSKLNIVMGNLAISGIEEPTLKEVADQLQVSTKTVRSYIEESDEYTVIGGENGEPSRVGKSL